MNDINSVEDALTKVKNFKSKYNRKKIIKQDDFNKEFEDEIKQHVLGDKNK